MVFKTFLAGSVMRFTETRTAKTMVLATVKTIYKLGQQRLWAKAYLLARCESSDDTKFDLLSSYSDKI